MVHGSPLSGHLSGSSLARRGTVPPTTVSRRVVAKPVRFRHSPATVTAPRGRRKSGRRPRGACSNLREKGRQDRCDPPARPLLRPRSEGFRVLRGPSDRPPRPGGLRLVFPSPSTCRAAPSARLAALIVVARPDRSPRAAPARTASTVAERLDRRVVATATPLADRPPRRRAPRTVAAFPVTLTDDERQRRHDHGRAAEDRVAHARHDRDPVRARRRRRVVGKVEDVDDYPPEADRRARRRDLSASSTSRRSSGSETDLVIAGGNWLQPARRGRPAARARRSRCSSSTPPTLDGVLNDIELIGTAVGLPAEADDADRRRCGPASTQSSAATAGLPKPRTFYEIDASTGPIYDRRRRLGRTPR